MKLKSWSKYFIIIVLILLMAFWGQYIFVGIRKNAIKTFENNIYLNNILMIIFYGGIGFLLGLEHLIEEIKKEGVWQINIPKLVLMGIPSLYFSLYIFIYCSSNQFVQAVLGYPIGILSKGSASFIAVFQLILGYSIITSFYKKKNKCENS